MSRIGKRPIALPKEVEVRVDGSQIVVKGPKGELSRELTGVTVTVEDGQVKVAPGDESRDGRARHGLARSLLANMVHGVAEGFKRELEINGTGFRADMKGDELTLELGFSHPIVFKLPAGVKGAVDKQTRITLTSIDKELLGLTAAKVRSFRPPEPYKGKGVKYAEETIVQKVGKSA